MRKLATMEIQQESMQMRQSIVTHELITPLKCIINFADDLKVELQGKPTGHREANLIFNTSKLLHAQVNELLDKNMMDRSMLVPKLEATSLVDIVKETKDILFQ